MISRIRYSQFGVMLTTSYAHSQAYKEVVEDGHPILIMTATDIEQTLRSNFITSVSIDEWLRSIDELDQRRIKQSNAYAQGKAKTT